VPYAGCQPALCNLIDKFKHPCCPALVHSSWFCAANSKPLLSIGKSRFVSQCTLATFHPETLQSNREGPFESRDCISQTAAAEDATTKPDVATAHNNGSLLFDR